jgi:RHS repeat-associated protein
VQGYVQGYHGLVKTLVGSAVYYYQDELGSTSHITGANVQLLEYYKYNLYGAPTYWDASGTQLVQGSNYHVRILGNGGSRWMPELGLYDDRNRFMSPDLGRFIQPDPIGFKGDASNLYRYCGNDWANRTDPMGLADNTTENPAWIQVASNLAFNLYNPMVRAGNVSGPDTNSTKQIETSGRAQSVKVAGSSGTNGNGTIKQDRESYDPSHLKHGDNNLKMAEDGADAAQSAEQATRDRREYHTFNFQNPANPKDFAQSPVRISGKEGGTNVTWIYYKDENGWHPMATAGNYKLVGVGFNHVRYRSDQIKGDLATFKANHLTGAVMTPTPSIGNRPPYYYDAARDFTYGPSN